MADASFVSPDDMVRVHNLSDRPLRLAYNSRAMTIPAHGDGFVSREAACMAFGIWWVTGDDRRNEYARIRGHYGCALGAAAEPSSPVWEDVRPQVEIYETDGTKVSTVIDDPTGENIPVTARDDEQHMRETVAALERQMETLKGQLETRDQIISAGIATDLPAPDSPQTAPKRERSKPVVHGAVQADTETGTG